jgi:hypothetical protein
MRTRITRKEMNYLLEKCDQYLDWGCEEVYVIDSQKRSIFAGFRMKDLSWLVVWLAFLPSGSGSSSISGSGVPRIEVLSFSPAGELKVSGLAAHGALTACATSERARERALPPDSGCEPAASHLATPFRAAGYRIR